LLAYLPALGNGYVWDDDDYVTANATLRSLAGLARIWLEPGSVPQYYPLTFTSLWLNYQIGGASPFGYHLVNVLLHATSAVLVWRVLHVLAVPGALLAAALFAVHPVEVESVAWATERKNTLSGVLYLSSMLAYLRFAGIGARGDGGRTEGRDAPGGDPAIWALSLVLFLLGLLAKTVVCTLPAALLLILWWQRGRLVPRDLAWLAPFFVLGGALALVTVRMESAHVGAVGRDWDLSFIERTLIAGRAVWFYLGKLAWPSPLIFIYPRWTIDAGAAWQYLFPAAALAATLALWLARARIGVGPLVAWLLFVATLGPALGFVDVFPMRYSFVADHFQYLASIAPLALAAALGTVAFRRGGERMQRAGVAVAVLVVAVCAVLTARQTRIYADIRTIWTDTLAKNPGAWMAHNNLGLLLFGEGRTDEAMAHYRAAIAVKPDDAFARNNLGRALASVGRLEDARAMLVEAVRSEPGNAEAWSNLGNVHAAAGRYDAALEAYRSAVAVRPSFADAYGNLGNVLFLTGRRDDAIAAYVRALELDPQFVDARRNLAIALADAGKLDDAQRQLEAALRLRPGWADAERDLADIRAARARAATVKP
jgi:Tfp pilus assembly protein PilF